jgi:hypothetical protein
MAHKCSVLFVLLGMAWVFAAAPMVQAAPDKTPGKAPETAPDKAPGQAPDKAPTAPEHAPEKQPEPKVTCTLVDAEVPRGGRLDVSGKGFGKAPVVRIAGKAVRMIERTDDTIAVQVPRKSNGGSVTVLADGHEVECGTLKIIGKN